MSHKVECNESSCQGHRVHWCDPDTPRGPQMVEVPDDWPKDRPAFCSMTCAIMGGYTKMLVENPCPNCLDAGDRVEHHSGYRCWR